VRHHCRSLSHRVSSTKQRSSQHWKVHECRRSRPVHRFHKNHRIAPNCKRSQTVEATIINQCNWKSTVNEIKTEIAKLRVSLLSRQYPEWQPPGSSMKPTKRLKANVANGAAMQVTAHAAASRCNISAGLGITAPRLLRLRRNSLQKVPPLSRYNQQCLVGPCFLCQTTRAPHPNQYSILQSTCPRLMAQIHTTGSKCRHFMHFFPHGLLLFRHATQQSPATRPCSGQC